MRMHISELKDNEVFMQNLRFDLKPDFLSKPRFATPENKEALLRETEGYMFYVDSMTEPVSLMLMKTYNLTSKTIGEIQDVPLDLLTAAIAHKNAQHYSGMYPIDAALEAWIKTNLGA